MFFLGILLLTIQFVFAESKSPFSKGRVYYLKIIQDFGVVSSSYSSYIKKNLEIVAQDPAAKAVILEVDTPGGAVSDAEKIIKYIHNTPVKTIAFINNSAFSAGALISLAADYTVISERGKIGDAYPIMIGKDGKPVSIEDKGVRAKILSGLRASIRSLAEKRKKRLIKEISAGMYPHLKNMTNSVRNMDKIFEAMIDPDIKLAKEEDGIDLKKDDLLTLSTEDAYRLGVVDGIHNQFDEVLTSYNLKQYDVVELKATTSDQLLGILVHQVTISILLTLGMMGMIMEFWTSGWGVPGTIGILALSLFFYGQIVGNDASQASIVLFLIGIILLGVEFFVIPGFGLVGVGGVIAILLSIFTALGVDFFDISKTSDKLSEAAGILLISLSITITTMIVFSKHIGKTKAFSRFTLKESKIASTSHKIHPELQGKEGIALSTLRPSGIAMIDGQHHDVVSNGEYIEKGSDIQVIDVNEGKVVVTKKL